MDRDDKEKTVEIQCKISRSSINKMKFKLKMSKQLEEIRDILSMIFDIDAFLATFRFYYNGQSINRLADIPNG